MGGFFFSLAPSAIRDVLNLRHGDERPIPTVEAQIGIQLGLGVHTDDRRRRHALRDDLDVAEFEVLARRRRVAFEDDGFGVREVGQAYVVPAWL